MKLDKTLTKILTEIQSEVLQERNIHISIEEIHSIVETQIEATKLGFAKGITVHWFKFCKFVFTNKHNNVKEIKQLNQRLEDNDDLLPHEKIAIKKNAIILKAESRDKLIKKSTLRTTESITVDSLMNIENVNIVKPLMFVTLTNKHSKK